MTDETEDLDQEPQAEAGEAVPGIEESDGEIVLLVKKCRKESDKHLAEWLSEAKDCYAIVAGDQWKQEDKAALEEMGRIPVVFNRVAPVIDSVCGSEVSNRQQVQYIPRQAGDSGVNEVLTGAAKWVRDNCDAEDEESDAFFDAVVCGLGWTETRLDYVDDPEGQVIIDRKDPLTVRYDPKAKKRNLVDKKWVSCDAWLTKEEIEEKWPDAELGTPGVQEMTSSSSETKPHDATNAWLYRENSSGYDAEQGKFLVVHYQWYTLQTYYKALDPLSQKIVELSAEKMASIYDEADKRGEREVVERLMDPAKMTRKVYKHAFVCGSMVLDKGLLPIQGDFTLHAITGKRDRNNNTWYGLVRPMADPQRWANKFFSQILHIINSNAKGGLVAEEDAVDNPRKLEEEWSKADSVVIVNPGAISGNKIMPKPAPAYPMAPEKMMEFSIASIRDTTGVNLELMGLADRQQAGYLEAQRKQSGMVILANFFDSLRRYRKNQGRILAEFIQEYISDGRLIRILGGDGTEKYVPLIRDQATMQFDVVVDESPTSHNNKEKVFGLFMNLIPAMQKMGLPPPPPEFVDYMPIPASFAEKWKQSMVQASQDPARQQQMQMQMRGAMLEQEKLAADAHDKHASAGLKEAQTVGEQIENGMKQVQATVNPMGMPMNPLPMQ